MASLNKIIYLSEEQKEELFENGSIEVEGRTINYNDNDLYITNKDEYINVRDLINLKADKIEVIESTNETELQPNKYYKWDEVASLSLTLGAPIDGILNEYMFEFVSGATPTTLTLPDTIKWESTPSIEANKKYQCSIVNNIGILVGVENV